MDFVEFVIIEFSYDTNRVLAKRCTGGPRYSRTFYLRICLFTLKKMVQNDNFPVKNVQDLRSKMTERIYREKRGKPVFLEAIIASLMEANVK
jgi:hypothetical protein